jgi:O-antigen/teichoic acid export membrane protein
MLVWVSAGWVAHDWLKVDRLPKEVVAQAIRVMALMVALRFVESIYRSALLGLQRQVWYNAVNAALATLRGVGAVAVLAFVSPTITAFFLWQAFVSLLSAVVLARGVHRALPRAISRPGFSVEALLRVWRFAGGMAGITLLAVALTQLDKALLSRLLSLEFFGYYTLAATVAATLGLIAAPITTAVFPRLVELIARADEDGVKRTYHTASQVVTVSTVPATLLLAVFGEGVLFAWSGDSNLSRNAGPLLSALAIGTCLNVLMYVPYQLQLAHGWTSLMLKLNCAAAVTLVPAIFWAVNKYGAQGAAWLWIALNAGYVIVGIQLMHKKIYASEKWRWYVQDIGVPTLAAGATLLLFLSAGSVHAFDRLDWVAFLSITLAGATMMSLVTCREIRSRIFVSLRGSLSR